MRAPLRLVAGLLFGFLPLHEARALVDVVNPLDEAIDGVIDRRQSPAAEPVANVGRPALSR
jgi:hypothetical protein